MLWMVLAVAVQADVDAFLLLCDTPRITRPCATYLQGYADSAQAHRELLYRYAVRGDVSVFAEHSHICFPEEVDLDEMRRGVVRQVRAPSDKPLRRRVLRALMSLYPCK